MSTTGGGATQLDEAEVVVIGAGPAGSSCAATLAEAGADVLVIDQSEFPRDKSCGDGLDPLALGHIQALGLDELVEEAAPITGVRTYYEQRQSRYRPWPAVTGKPWPARCLPRLVLDAALLGAAKARGARFAVARAKAPLRQGGRVAGVLVDGPAGDALIRARYVVACDGATSRMRRELVPGVPEHGVAAFGVRQYYRTERELEPVFHFYGPVEFEEVRYAGYAWVFPIAERIANVGVGVFSGPGMAGAPPLRGLLEQFVDALRTRGRAQFGDLEPTGKVLGSPVGMGFDADRCQAGAVAFAGDAARMTDPFIGEGISNALEGGAIVADIVAAARRRRRPSVGEVGRVLGERFPRLGQNMGTLGRLGVLAMNADGGDLAGKRREDTLPVVRRLVSAVYPHDVRWSRTPVGELVARLDPAAAQALDEANSDALALLETRHPYLRELLARQMVAGPGPVAAATVVAAERALGREPTPHGRALAVAVSLMSATQAALRELVEPPRSRMAEYQNATMLLGLDLATTGAWLALAELPEPAVRELVVWSLEACSGAHVAARNRFDLAQPAAAHEEASQRVFGAGGAAALGAVSELAGEGGDRAAALRAAGRAIARAHQLAFEVCELLQGDEATSRHRALDARQGLYGLPVLHAGHSPDVRRLLARGLEREDIEAFVAAVVAAGGVDRALEECRRWATAAERAIDAAALPQPRALRAIASLGLELAAGAGAAISR